MGNAFIFFTFSSTVSALGLMRKRAEPESPWQASLPKNILCLFIWEKEVFLFGEKPVPPAHRCWILVLTLFALNLHLQVARETRGKVANCKTSLWYPARKIYIRLYFFRGAKCVALMSHFDSDVCTVDQATKTRIYEGGTLQQQPRQNSNNSNSSNNNNIERVLAPERFPARHKRRKRCRPLRRGKVAFICY